MAGLSSAFVLLILLLFSLFFKVCVCVKIVDVNIPSLKLRGEPARLTCNYDLEGDTLYSVKWYKNGREFFRYLPRDNPPLQFITIPGITIEVGKSTKSEVFLKALNLDSTGRYHCEVSAEGPSFKSAIYKAEMVVVDLPDELPRITGSSGRYSPGDTLHVNCTSYRSKPAASLQWYINNRMAGRDQLIEYVPRTELDGLETSILGLRFTVSDNHFISDQLRIRCTSTIATVYYEGSELVLSRTTEPQQRQQQGVADLNAQTKHFSSNEESGCWISSYPDKLVMILWIAVLLYIHYNF